ncbi:MAG: carboxypeptidase-like regulatory domain-containing protein [Planctomycetota bacterium]
MHASKRRLLLLAIFACSLAGCGPDLHSGKGVVQFTDGEPLHGGSVELRSRDYGAQYASRIDTQGGFQLTSRDGTPGVPPGEYDAVVVLIVMTDVLSAEQHTHGRNVPMRYFDYKTSDLAATIPTAQSGPIELVLEPE